MKRNLFQGRALTALFVLLLSVVGMKNAFAQNQIATLQHNDTITGVYYGENALFSAYGAAVDGDIITLSSGTFNFNNYSISKTITIHGAGCVYDTVTLVTPSIVSGNFSLEHDFISFEGILFTGMIDVNCFLGAYATSPGTSYTNISFAKCNITKIYNSNNRPNNTWSLKLYNCLIKEFASQYFYNTLIINSVVRFTSYTHTSNSSYTNIYNSVILFDNNVPVKNIVLYNSIIATNSGHEVSNCTFNNCIGIKTGETSLFEGQIVQNVMEVDGYDDVFKTFAGTVFYENLYQLKDGIANSFLGQDGTEVGIYGGMMPYDPRPSYMRMKRCNVASRSTVDGKLSVDIEVLTDDE